jgi:hypothetical protein
MKATPSWLGRAWLPYSVAGLAWMTVGGLLGKPRGLGLIFIGLACLGIGLGLRARRR